MMDGEIWVESELGQGSCFGFRLPLVVSNGSQINAPELPENLNCVMIVDDMEVNREILNRQLQRLGLKVLAVNNGAEALEKVSDEVDLVITDRNLPGMDGLKLARSLRHAQRNMPVLLLSSDPADSRDPAIREIFSGVLQKPLPRGALFTALAGLNTSTMDVETSPAPTDTTPPTSTGSPPRDAKAGGSIRSTANANSGGRRQPHQSTCVPQDGERPEHRSAVCLAMGRKQWSSTRTSNPT